MFSVTITGTLVKLLVADCHALMSWLSKSLETWKSDKGLLLVTQPKDRNRWATSWENTTPLSLLIGLTHCFV